MPAGELSTRARARLAHGKALATAALLASVTLAFADSSIVVLGLPDMLNQFDVSIESGAWVITSYNAALALTALVLTRVVRRGLNAPRVAKIGCFAFLAASALCSISPDVWLLVALRSAQGVGAGLLLVGALPFIRSAASTPARGTAIWVGAGVLGASVGPVSGGLLTEMFGWRAIFLAQIPIAAGGIAGLMFLREESGDRAPQRSGVKSPRRRSLIGVALCLVSGALVGLLFLVVVQLIDVWRLTPLGAAAVISVLPVATALGIPLSAVVDTGSATAGVVLLAGGLGGMAFLPALSLAWVIAALAISGIGLGLLLPRLTQRVIATYDSPLESSAQVVWLRHAGLVAGLLVLAPIFGSDLSAAGNSAKLRGIAVVLDAPAPASTKLHLALDLAPTLGRPPRKQLPNFAHAVSREHDAAVAAIGHDLDSVVQATVTRGFRRSFFICGLFALAALVPLALTRRRTLLPRRSARAPAIALVVVAALIGGELAGGASAFGARPRLLAPCAQRPAPVLPGPHAQAQRLVLAGIDLLGCQLHRRREDLIADLAKRGIHERELVSRLQHSTKLTSLAIWLWRALGRPLP